VLDSLITSKTRIRILMRLFLNPLQKAYLRELATEFEMSPGQLSDELRNLSSAGLLSQVRDGRLVNYSANTGHPLFPELQSIVRKALGMDRILDSVIERLGNVELAILLDDYAQGKDTGIIDLLLVGDINRENLADLVAKTERYIERKIRVLTMTSDEYEKLQPVLATRPKLTLWQVKEDV
jgi:DNA-binding transcriptional ArsR family regulator